jgi:hypothetical protein
MGGSMLHSLLQMLWGSMVHVKMLWGSMGGSMLYSQVLMQMLGGSMGGSMLHSLVLMLPSQVLMQMLGGSLLYSLVLMQILYHICAIWLHICHGHPAAGPRGWTEGQGMLSGGFVLR